MDGFARLIGRGSGEMANRVLKLADVLGPKAGDLGSRLGEAHGRETRFRLLDEALAGWLGEGCAPRPEIAWAFARLSRDPAARVAELARDIGWSRKTLSDQFRARYGLSPKTVGRLARFQRVIAATEGLARPDG